MKLPILKSLSKWLSKFTFFFYIGAPVTFFALLIFLMALYQGAEAKSLIEIHGKDLRAALQPLLALLGISPDSCPTLSTMIDKIVEAFEEVEQKKVESSNGEVQSEGVQQEKVHLNPEEKLSPKVDSSLTKEDL
jgi:hypothetical protein